MSFTGFEYELFIIPIRDLLVVNVIPREGDAQVQASLRDDLRKFILIVDICSCTCSKEEPGLTRLCLLGTLQNETSKGCKPGSTGKHNDRDSFVLGHAKPRWVNHPERNSSHI